MEPTLLITSFVTIFVIVDPIGLTPIFFSLTQDLSTIERRVVAIDAVFGEMILTFIGISTATLQKL